jgi:Mg/Co/Ni transporter MgtE
MIKKNVLLGLTTTSNSNWREKINEINKYNIKDIALFLTGIEHEERKELYSLLKKTDIKSIYHVHARGDMSEKEIQYFSGYL